MADFGEHASGPNERTSRSTEHKDVCDFSFIKFYFHRELPFSFNETKLEFQPRSAASRGT